jgi:hypothetical protein
MQEKTSELIYVRENLFMHLLFEVEYKVKYIPAGYKVSTGLVPGVGNCLLEAILKALDLLKIPRGEYKTHRELRNAVIEVFKKDISLIDDRANYYVFDKQGSRIVIKNDNLGRPQYKMAREKEEVYLARMGNEGEYCDECFFRGIAFLFQRPIEVFMLYTDSTVDEETFQVTVFCPIGCKNETPIRIPHVDRIHYELFIPLDNGALVVKDVKVYFVLTRRLKSSKESLILMGSLLLMLLRKFLLLM